MRVLVGAIAFSIILKLPVQAQLPFIPNWGQAQDSAERVIAACIRLDGYCLFKIADQPSDLSERIETIEQRLNDISATYVKNDNTQLRVYAQPVGNLQNIYISVNGESVRLLSVTNWDAQLEGVDIKTRAEQIVERLEIRLKRAKQERQAEFLLRQSIIATGIGVAILISSFTLSRWQRKSKHSKEQLVSGALVPQPISAQLNQRQQLNLKEVQYRLLQVAQAGIWTVGTLVILSLFPYTRIIPVLVIATLRIPLQLGIVSLGTYLLIRLSYALIEQFNSALANNYLLSYEANQRLQLRVATISAVTRSIVTISWIAIGIVVALSVTGVDVAPLLAGVGILGVGLSLASQNLIKDAINGFFIILEDQYAVGDMINVGNVSGLVENINLRITQLRDSEGRLITIPNSEIKIVANLSSTWSRADLNIPVAYQTDIDKALHLIEQVAETMSEDSLWQEQILESPQVLGVDNFGDKGVMIKVWIKTQPLKQWDVSREFRRRIKIAFDEAEIPLPLP